MAKEIAIGKRAKISEAQQYMLFSVLAASVVLGVATSLTTHFIQQISFNAQVISAEDGSIVAYSNVIKATGICESPKGSVYSDEELKKCNPDSIDVSKIPGTLRANILENLAASKALNSVPKEATSNCIDPDTGKNYTYEKLNEIYNKASGSAELVAVGQLIKSCSALRIIPDALPAFKNEEALLASLNKLFNDSNWQPESLSPSGSSSVSESIPGLNTISVDLSVEADTGTTMTVLNNIERSIREFNIERAAIEWGGDNMLNLHAQATAYYMNESTITETKQTIKAEGNK